MRHDILIICQPYSFVIGERHVRNRFVLQAVELCTVLYLILKQNKFETKLLLITNTILENLEGFTMAVNGEDHSVYANYKNGL